MNDNIQVTDIEENAALKMLHDNSIDLIILNIEDEPTTNIDAEKYYKEKIKNAWSEYERVIKPNGAICVIGKEPFISTVRMKNIRSYKYDMIWNNANAEKITIEKTKPINTHESIAVFNTNIWNQRKCQNLNGSIIRGNKEEMTECIINAYTKPKQIVLDSRMANGETGIACINTDRGFRGIEERSYIYDNAYKKIVNRAKCKNEKEGVKGEDNSR